jgi:hypothetical protein
MKTPDQLDDKDDNGIDTERFSFHRLIKAALEVMKWGLIVWLMIPVSRASRGPVDILRVIAGILLFIIFTGKLLYDRIFADMIRGRRRTPLQDLLGSIGIILIVVILTGILIFFIGELVVALMRQE